MNWIKKLFWTTYKVDCYVCNQSAHELAPSPERASARMIKKGWIENGYRAFCPECAKMMFPND